MVVREQFGVLHSAAVIQQQVDLNAGIIDQYCATQRIDELDILICLNGAMPYATDLTRALSRCNPGLVQIQHTIKVSRYGDEMIGSSRFEVVQGPSEKIHGRHVLIVEDIVDEGRTLQYVNELVWAQQPLSVAITAITEKIGAQIVPVPIRLTPALPIRRDANGRFPWVVGYGLDLCGKMREKDDILYLVAA